jgi:hypothetical protein
VAQEARAQHASVIGDHQIARGQERWQVPEPMVRDLSARAVDHEEARSIAGLGRSLRDQGVGQLKIIIR